MRRRLPVETTNGNPDGVRRVLRRVSELGYTDNAKNTDDKRIERFIRWLEGTWEPAAPRSGPAL